MTTIEWTDRTINPGIYGCQAISPACAHCYAAPMARRLEGMGAPGYRDGSNVKGRQWTGKVRVDFDRVGPAFSTLPKRKPCRVFVTSMADLFHHDVPFSFIDLVFAEMASRPHITFQVLTKRPARAVEWWEHVQSNDPDATWPTNVWIGCTVEDQRRADERIPHLLRIPAPVRFLSVEPMLGLVDLQRWVFDWLPQTSCSGVGGQAFTGVPTGKIGWVIAGGESGPHARPSHPDWFRSLRDQCVEAEVPFLFKQWGEWRPVAYGDKVGPNMRGLALDGSRPDAESAQKSDAFVYRIGKQLAGRTIDGRTWDQFPEVAP